MSYNDDTPCLYIEGATNLQDLLMPDGKTQYSRLTVEEYRAKHPTENVLELPLGIAVERIARARRLKYCATPTEITEEAYDDALNVLPPEHWEKVPGGSIFRMMEYMDGMITAHYVSLHGRYFHAYREVGVDTYDTLAAEVRRLFFSEPQPA